MDEIMLGEILEIDNFLQSDELLPSESSKEQTGPAVENTGRWTDEEHQLFLQGLELHGKGWKKIADLIQTRTVVQIRTHAQKYFLKIQRAEQMANKSRAAAEGRTSAPVTRKRFLTRHTAALERQESEAKERALSPVPVPARKPVLSRKNSSVSSYSDATTHCASSPSDSIEFFPPQDGNDGYGAASVAREMTLNTQDDYDWVELLMDSDDTLQFDMLLDDLSFDFPAPPMTAPVQHMEDPRMRMMPAAPAPIDQTHGRFCDFEMCRRVDLCADGSVLIAPRASQAPMAFMDHREHHVKRVKSHHPSDFQRMSASHCGVHDPRMMQHQHQQLQQHQQQQQAYHSMMHPSVQHHNMARSTFCYSPIQENFDTLFYDHLI